MIQSIDIYTQFGCPYCARAKQLLQAKGAEYREIDAPGGSTGRTEMQQRAPGSRTVPQIFIGGAHVGGCDDLHALDNAGRLDAMLVLESPS
jgi:glutaredoxin 3